MIENPNEIQYKNKRKKKKLRQNESNNCRQADKYEGSNNMPSKIERGIWKIAHTPVGLHSFSADGTTVLVLDFTIKLCASHLDFQNTIALPVYTRSFTNGFYTLQLFGKQ